MFQYSIIAMARCVLSLCVCKYLFLSLRERSHISLYRGIRRFKSIEPLIFASGAQKTLSKGGGTHQITQKNQTCKSLFRPSYQLNSFKAITFIRTTCFCFGGPENPPVEGRHVGNYLFKSRSNHPFSKPPFGYLCDIYENYVIFHGQSP